MLFTITKLGRHFLFLYSKYTKDMSRTTVPTKRKKILQIQLWKLPENEKVWVDNSTFYSTHVPHYNIWRSTGAIPKYLFTDWCHVCLLLLYIHCLIMYEYWQVYTSITLKGEKLPSRASSTLCTTTTYSRCTDIHTGTQRTFRAYMSVYVSYNRYCILSFSDIQLVRTLL